MPDDANEPASDVGAALNNDARHFINNMKLRFGLSEIFIDLGQVNPEQDIPHPNFLFVTTPEYLLEMENQLSDALDLYQGRFGTIATNGEPAGGAHG